MPFQALESWLRRVRRILGELRFRRMEIDQARRECPGARLAEGAQLVSYLPARLRAAPSSTVCEGTVLAFRADVNGSGSVVLGRQSWIGQCNNLRACDGGDIVAGAYCLMSQFCTLVGGNRATRRDRPIRDQGPERSRLGVVLENDVWLGAGVTVLPGVVVGRGPVIGPNSVVSESVPQYKIWAGCPARRLGARL